MLADLGLLPALRAMAIETSALVFANRHGQTIYRDARGLDGGYSQPQLSIHSALRRQFNPSEGAPRWNGMMMCAAPASRGRFWTAGRWCRRATGAPRSSR